MTTRTSPASGQPSAAAASPDEPRSIPEMLRRRLQATPEREAFQYPVGTDWRTVKWGEVGDQVRAIALGLHSLGLTEEQRCAILSGTRIEWILIDLGILCAGGATTTVYPASTADECAFILQDSASSFVFAENETQVAKLVAKRAELPEVKKVIAIEPAPDHGGWVMPLSGLMDLGRQQAARDPALYDQISQRVGPTHLATLIYTSGTTGKPKGVELTHDNWVYEGEGIDALGMLRPDDKQFLWLPLAHSFGKVLELAQIRIGFSTAIDGRVDKIVENLGIVRPTFVAAVPRIFEKVHNKVVSGAMEAGGLKAKIFQWAMKVGHQCSALEQAGKKPGGLLAAKRAVADKLVFSKLKEKFGGRLRFFVSGSAPLARPLAEFFHAAGILIMEGYGLTESSAASFVNLPHRYKFGTVGAPLPGTEVKIAPDGEILLRGRGIMRGYHGLKEATADVFEGDWFRTGDIGEVDERGLLKITDRKKELIKTSGGKYVAPQHLEGELKALCPYISQVVVHGDNRNFCSALITLDEESLKRWAAGKGLTGSYSELTAKPEVFALIKPYIDQLNAKMPSYSTLKKFAILPEDFTIEAGDLTTSLKVKRRVIEKKHMALLDSLYEGPRRD